MSSDSYVHLIEPQLKLQHEWEMYIFVKCPLLRHKQGCICASAIY